MSLVDDPFPLAFAKMVGMTGIAVATVLAPFVYFGVKNNDAMSAEIAQIDAKPSVVFNSVSNCTDEGYDENVCLQSKTAATSLANGWGTEMSYASPTKCFNTHGTCYNDDGFLFTVYYPFVKGWQAAKSDLTKAVPLYQYNDPSYLIRADGKLFPTPKPH